MGLEQYISRERCLVLDVEQKDTALQRLSEVVTAGFPAQMQQLVTELVFDREAAVSSRVAAGIAIPHAVNDAIPESRIACGLCPEGILWEPKSSDRVYLIFLLIGTRADHLPILSELAGRLQDGPLYEELVSARSSDELYERFAHPAEEREGILTYGDRDISRITFEQARQMAGRIDAAKLLVHADAIRDAEYLFQLVHGTRSLVVSTNPNKFSPERSELLARDGTEMTVVPFRGMRRSAHVQFTLLFLLSQNLLSSRDIVVNVFGMPGAGYFDSIRLTYIEREFDFPFSFQGSGLGSAESRHVLVRVLQLASELAAEGREGKAVGTIFVLGDSERVLKRSRQMIVNPFSGTAEVHRNILDPSLEETIKEYAKIDGAFIIREDGVILAGGAYLTGAPESEELHPGLGARHAAALAITESNAALAIVISESTRKISIYHGGKRILNM